MLNPNEYYYYTFIPYRILLYQLQIYKTFNGYLLLFALLLYIIQHGGVLFTIFPIITMQFVFRFS